MRTTNVVVLGSNSKGKLEEYKSLFKTECPNLELRALSDLVFNVSSLKEAENGKNYFENAHNKGKLSHLACKYPTLSEDTGLEVDALGGKPGLFTARFASQTAGLPQDKANIKKLLEELKSVPKEKRSARFVCTTVFFVEGVVLTATETLEGTILETPRGEFGFGYDSVFCVKGSDKSLAEMSLEEKNAISHRAKAFRSILNQIKEKEIKLVRP